MPASNKPSINNVIKTGRTQRILQTYLLHSERLGLFFPHGRTALSRWPPGGALTGRRPVGLSSLTLAPHDPAKPQHVAVKTTNAEKAVSLILVEPTRVARSFDKSEHTQNKRSIWLNRAFGTPILVEPCPCRPQRQRRENAQNINPAGTTKIMAAPEFWWSQTGSNRRPTGCKPVALPTELWPLSCALNANQNERATNVAIAKKLVGRDGLEPSTSRLSGVRSNRLSYRPP